VSGLNLRSKGTLAVKTAAGRRDLEQSYAQIEIQGKDLVTHILVSDELETVLIGVTTLEALAFAVDPNNQKLVETELLLL
jgi:predicted aspartyl protease